MIKSVLFVSILAWLILVVGIAYSHIYVSNEFKTELSIMSPRTITAVTTIYIGWFVSCLALFLSLVVLHLKGGSKALYASLALSSIYVIPVGVLYVL